VDMVGHQAIANQRHPMEFNVLEQQIEINHAISIDVQDKSPRIPTLRDMVRYINGNDASQTCHGLTLPENVRKRSVCQKTFRLYCTPKLRHGYGKKMGDTYRS
jgi:hypothetical protein